MNDQFKEYQTELLLLLVGTNPLPNYVAANLLLKPGGTLQLIHSYGPKGTGAIAQRLAGRLPQFRHQLVPVDPLDTAKVRSEILRYLTPMPPGPIGLNYTGGTKLMAVHAYRAVQEFCLKRGSDAVFSYLNADTLELLVEPAPGRNAFRQKVVTAIQVELPELFELHNIGLVGKINSDPQLPTVARALAHLNGSPSGVHAWQAARPILAQSNGSEWDSVASALVDVGVDPKAIDALAQVFGFSEGTAIDLRAAAGTAGLKSSLEVTRYLDGVWLEDWALECVKSLGYAHRARSLTGRLGARQIEIDLAVLRGYQFFAISSSVTPDVSKAKAKLLEVYTRARQLGGDEACIGLLAPALPDPDLLQQDVAQEWGAEKRVRIFGASRLPQLQTEFKSWFESV